MVMQIWPPFAKGLLSGREIHKDHPGYANAAAVVKRLAKEKGTGTEAILVAWLLRIPAGVQPVIGTLTPERIKSACEGDTIELSREEWYELFIAGRGGRLS